MTESDLQQPDPGPLRAAAEAAELADATHGLVSVDGCRLTGHDPHAPLARAIARSLTEAGLPVHRCARHDPRHRLGGACVMATGPGLNDGRGGVMVSWTTHRLLSVNWDSYRLHRGTRDAMNEVIGGILGIFGFEAGPFGSGGAWLVTGRHGQDPGAGR